MSSLVKILSNKDIKAFDFPPEFHGEERKHFFISLTGQVNSLKALGPPPTKLDLSCNLVISKLQINFM